MNAAVMNAAVMNAAVTNLASALAALLLLGCGASGPAAATPDPSASAEAPPAEAAAPAGAEPPSREACGPMQIATPDPLSPPPGAERTASGLVSQVLCRGTGTVHPGPEDTVTVHYTGWRHISGERFDSSVERGEPASFPLNQVIAGWTEGLQLMVEGERRRFWIPAELAYGARPRPGMPSGMLVFDVDLLSMAPPRAAGVPPTPADVAGPPPEAQRTASGLAWVVLQGGTGAVHPGPTDRVLCHYTGWRAANGERFDSSEERGEPVTFPLDGLIPGFSEAVQQMVVGERVRVWIPVGLAYQGREGRPEGMLVFEIELLGIE